jgi:sarcosine oxidase, subunit alpha
MMVQKRIISHPILPIPKRREVPFTFNGESFAAFDGEVISSALIAGGVTVFGHHKKDGGPQGIFCANGQCSQCLVIADNVPVKSCMVPVTPGMRVQSLEGLPILPADDSLPVMQGVLEEEIRVLIIGGGPAGISAAIELGKAGIETLLIDDKQELGGKLTLQTHAFFGSVADCWAGTRGIDIAKILTDELSKYSSVKVWLNASAVGCFEDQKIGIVRDRRYFLVKPGLVLIATGAREKNIAFPGCDLPGVYGAGAFQTLVNRDLVRSAERLFIVGGGNVGLIAGYHALQAGIKVVGLVEALPKCGGYKVHEDKLRRLGVPVLTSHTVLRVDGDGKAERVTIAAIDQNFKPIAGTEHTYEVDTVLIAVGLSPVDELLKKARLYQLPVWAAGDAEEIAEASAAIFSGKITGRKILESLEIETTIPSEWTATSQILRSKPGATCDFTVPDERRDVYPVIRCVQEIPCSPCAEACPIHRLEIPGGNIMRQPLWEGPDCLGCSRCVAACPGLAIVLIDERADPSHLTALVTVPWEFSDGVIRPGDRVATVGFEADKIGTGVVKAVKRSPEMDRRRLVMIEVPWNDRHKVAAFEVQVEHAEELPYEAPLDDDVIICRCERVTRREIVEQIRAGAHDFNQLKATVRSGMGACGGKTCRELIYRIFREEGVDLKEVTPFTERPFLAEVPMKYFAGADK